MFLRFESQGERKEYGGSCFIEFQFCKLPVGTKLDQIVHSNMSEDYFDYYGITYYAPDKIEPIIERLLSAKPEGYDVLNKWLEEAKKYNGFYILGL